VVLTLDDDKGDPQGETLGDEVETSLNELIAETNPHDQLAAMHQVAETGEVSPELIAQVAQSMDIEPEALTGQVVGNAVS